eukprot:TRINITY_DN2876_c0_g1_i1.p1 TRINITY_DN2876_c0_g1~~TRINITY_DN2876_c0_g1_i1.p1  ORF type:complete len:325 (+),score=117.20 TRINITY_DN2876_c0_g1_i1:74-976(+)
MTTLTRPSPKDSTQPTQSALVRRTWNGRSSPIPKLPQAELIRKLEEEEIATLALHSKLKEVVNARMELEELKKKIQQMLSDVRDALSVIDGKGADLEHSNSTESTIISTDDDSNSNSSNNSVHHHNNTNGNSGGHNNNTSSQPPAVSDEERKKLEEEERARKKAEERIQKERKKAEERQKKIREKEGSMLGQKQDSADSEKNDHMDSSSGGEIQIEVKSAFRKVEGITIDQLRQDALKAQAEEAEKGDKEKSSDWSMKRISKSILKKKDKKPTTTAADNLAMVMKMKAELIAQQKAAGNK